MRNKGILEMSILETGFNFDASIETAQSSAQEELSSLTETIQSITLLKPECDKQDYALAASSGVLCGLIDIFLVGKPGEAPIGKLSDKWFAERTIDFARLCGKDTSSLSVAIRHLESEFGIPYDQRGAGDAGSSVFDLTPTNHHFKSLGHNPTLLGLFFSILDQFTNQAHFVSGGELVALQDANGKFTLKGNSVTAKFFCGFFNWFGHLISDMSGSPGSKGRGMGIPSPLWAWMNDIIVIRRQLNLPVMDFDNNLNELAVNIYKQGFDIRFQAAQTIPVFINETIVRVIYAIRRMLKYFVNTKLEKRSASALWEACEPFANPTVKRMLTVAHGTFCLMDIGGASIQGLLKGGGGFNACEFCLCLNIVGVGRFAISLFGDTKRVVGRQASEADVRLIQREITFIENYLAGLNFLAEIYNDKDLVNFVEDFKNSNIYLRAFEKSVKLAELRQVPEKDILKTKMDIDLYFRGNK